jgi:CO/xanthine dehydrogenase Mo-binding subunit
VRLAPQPEPADDRAIALDVLVAEVIEQPAALPDEDRLASFLCAADSDEIVLFETVPAETVAAVTGSAPVAPVARTVSATYHRPYLAHASLGPSCAVAVVHNGDWSVWTHSQGVFPLRRELARALGVEPDRFTVHHVEGAGCYGHNGADDVALDAALLARAAEGRPMRVQWSRADELTHAPFGPAMAVEIAADLDASGEIIGWRHSIWGNGHTSRPNGKEPPKLLAAAELQNPFPRLVAANQQQPYGGADRNASPLYDFPSWQIEFHRLLVMPIRTSALRSLGGQCNVFAIESMIDEIACECGEDPAAFRLRHLRDARARAVIEAVAQRANWKPERQSGIGHGLGFARYKNLGAYCAAVAEIEATDEIRVRKLTLVADVGEAINPDGVLNQLEGGAVQATSWALKERVRFDRQRSVSARWSDYPILRFSEVPDVEVILLSRPEMEPLGAGEAALGPVTAAIANAVFGALGVRIHDLPISRDRLLQAIENAS